MVEEETSCPNRLSTGKRAARQPMTLCDQNHGDAAGGFRNAVLAAQAAVDPPVADVRYPTSTAEAARCNALIPHTDDTSCSTGTSAATSLPAEPSGSEEPAPDATRVTTPRFWLRMQRRVGASTAVATPEGTSSSNCCCAPSSASARPIAADRTIESESSEPREQGTPQKQRSRPWRRRKGVAKCCMLVLVMICAYGLFIYWGHLLGSRFCTKYIISESTSRASLRI